MKEPKKQIDKKGLTVTFGLQPSHIGTIEAELKRWNTFDNEEEDNPNMMYCKAVWDSIGRKVGWCPFTLALYYFEHIEKSKQV